MSGSREVPVTLDVEARPPLAPPVVAPPPKPYRGISAFRFIDQPIFFAREDDVRRLVRLTTVYRGVLLYGASGVGKSSLVNAGFIPAALRQGYTPERLRVRPVPGQEIVVERILVGPEGTDEALPSTLFPPGCQDARTALSVAEFEERVRAMPADASPLLIVDQFEEFVTLFEDAPPEGMHELAPLMQHAIMDALVALLNDHDVPVKLVFSFREDYLARLSKLIGQVPGLADRHVRLLAPGADDLETIIAGPLRRFPEQFGGRIPEPLVADVVGAFRARVGAGAVVPSEVQIACRKLWESEQPEALFRSNGIDGILGAYFTDEIRKFVGAEQQDAIAALLSRMVTRTGVRNVVSRDDLLTLVRADTSMSEGELETLLVALDGNETRLVLSEQRQGVLYYTIASEFLIPWIREQQAAQKREAEKRAAAADYARQLEETKERAEVERLQLEAKHAAERHDAERSKKRRWVAAFAMLSVLAATILTQYVKLRKATEADAIKSAALATANAGLLATEDSIKALLETTRLRADSIADSLTSVYAKADVALRRADSLERNGAASLESLQAQLAAERRARQQLQAAYARDTTRDLSVESTLDATRKQLADAREDLRQARLLVQRHEAVLSDMLRAGGDLRDFANKVCRGERALCPAAVDAKQQYYQAAPRTAP